MGNINNPESVDDVSAWAEIKSARRDAYGVSCRQCIVSRPKAAASILLPQQQCRVCGFRDPRLTLHTAQLNAVVAPRESWAPWHTERLFFAVYPDDSAQRAAIDVGQRVRRDFKLTGRTVEPSQMHVVAVSLGNFKKLSPPIVKKASAAANALSTRAFYLAFDHLASFPEGPRRWPLSLHGDDGAAAFTDFQETVESALKRSGMGGVTRPYIPHLTIMDDSIYVGRQAVDIVAWKVREFYLVRSLLGRDEHEVLGRWAFLP